MEQKELEKLVGQAIRLIDLADYQEGSVVSRTIIDQKTGTVTFFAFDEGQGLSEHTAPFDALVYLLDGEAEIVISGKAIRLKQGEMVIMPANQPHALKAIRNFKMILTMIRSIEYRLRWTQILQDITLIKLLFMMVMTGIRITVYFLQIFHSLNSRASGTMGTQ